MWLGAWRTTRQWQDKIFAEEDCLGHPSRRAACTGHFASGVAEDVDDDTTEVGDQEDEYDDSEDGL